MQKSKEQIEICEEISQLHLRINNFRNLYHYKEREINKKCNEYYSVCPNVRDIIKSYIIEKAIISKELFDMKRKIQSLNRKFSLIEKSKYYE